VVDELDVLACHRPQLVRRLESIGGLRDEPGRRQLIEALALAARAQEREQRLALEVLHRDEVAAVRVSEVVDIDDVRMLDHRGDARLGEEHVDERLLGGQVLVDELDHHELLETGRTTLDGTSAIPPWPIRVISSYRPSVVPPATTHPMPVHRNPSAILATYARVGMTLTVVVEPHPLLEIGAFVARLRWPLAECPTPGTIAGLARRGVELPHNLSPVSEQVKTRVRDLLRHGGFKPAGRSKPASEYLTGALDEGRFPSINALVDACNVASLHSGLPISLVDADLTRGDIVVRVAPANTSYVFNPSGQTIDASGLVCLYDGEGPTGTPVKDAQRTKTHDGTRNALAIVWGTSALPNRTAATTHWFRSLAALTAGATLEDVRV
jgi:DNA/RNA-binding domain of Phe-tRNA-synthetase-like protein